MSVTLSDYALTDLDTVLSFRQGQGETLNTTPEQKELLKFLINTYTEMFEKNCDRLFKSRTITEYLDGEGDYTLIPKQYPISSITSINDDGNWVWGDDTLVSSSAYRIKNNRVIVLGQSTGYFGDYDQNIKLVYVAGYTTIPSDLEFACITEVIRAFDHITSLGVESGSFLEVSETYIPMPFLPQTRAVLNNYMRKAAF